jgi:hypothetical protein
MANEFQFDVFLSHSVQDRAVVRVPSLSASNGERIGVRCRSLLKLDGVRVWLDEEQLPSPVGAGEGGRLRGRRSPPGEGRGAKADSLPAKMDLSLLKGCGGTRETPGQSRWLASSTKASQRRRMFCTPAHCVRLDSQPSTLNSQPIGDPLNQERRFIPLRFDAAAPSGLNVRRRQTEHVSAHGGGSLSERANI